MVKIIDGVEYDYIDIDISVYSLYLLFFRDKLKVYTHAADFIIKSEAGEIIEFSEGELCSYLYDEGDSN